MLLLLGLRERRGGGLVIEGAAEGASQPTPAFHQARLDQTQNGIPSSHPFVARQNAFPEMIPTESIGVVRGILSSCLVLHHSAEFCLLA